MITKRQSRLTEEENDSNENSLIIKKLSTTRKKSYKKWTKDEDDRLREYINSHHDVKDWSSISKYVGNGRTDAQCQHRWERFLDPSITKGPWTDEEDKKVIELVHDYGARHWSLIAKELKGRVGKQCRERWHNHLNPLINKDPWTNEENLRLFILHQHFGNKWAEIAKYFNGRSDNSIKNHWNSSMKKKFHLEVENLKKQGLDWTALIPSDFPWPKFDQSISNRSTRIPLRTITNQTSPKHSSIIKKNLLSSSLLSNIKTENHLSIMNSNHSSEELEQLFYNTSPSPIKQLPMLSSCSNYISSQSDDHLLSLLSTDTNDEDLFIIKSNNENISNTSSPTKYRVLNTPERPHFIRFTPSPKRDCFNEYLPFSESIISEHYSSIYSNKYDLSKNLQEKLGYNPTYTEILTGQTRDQRYVTEQARRYLFCSSLNNL